MKRYLTLKKDFNIKLQSEITKYLIPKYIYLPIESEDEIHSNIMVKKEEKISTNLISPVSGKIVGMKYCLTEKGKVTKCLTILNDYKETMFERHSIRKKMTKVSLEEMLIELKEFHYNDLADKIFEKKEAKILLLSGLEDEPYVANEIFIGKEYTNMVLETLDALKDIVGIKNVKIIIKNNDREGIEAYSNFLGTYPDMELIYVPDYYLIGNNDFLKEYLHIKESNLIIRPSELRIIYNTIKRRRYTTESIFTISGNAIKNPQIIEAKIGSPLNEIMEQYIHLEEKDFLIYVNGIMKGSNLECENLIVTPELKSLLIMKNIPIKENDCINCGKCYQVCPVGCNPRAYLKNHKKREVESCIDCGLCTYICPSFINLRKVINGDKNEQN